MSALLLQYKTFKNQITLLCDDENYFFGALLSNAQPICRRISLISGGGQCSTLRFRMYSRTTSLLGCVNLPMTTLPPWMQCEMATTIGYTDKNSGPHTKNVQAGFL